jgi:hypothetical protein
MDDMPEGFTPIVQDYKQLKFRHDEQKYDYTSISDAIVAEMTPRRLIQVQAVLH